MVDLIQHSIEVIRRWQQPSGAYPACPTMPDYQFCWFRDGSFIAHAMALYEQMESATGFHNWAAQTILRYGDGARQAMNDFSAGRTPNKHDVLRARYTYEGGKGPDDWPEFQLDGLGTWLWSLEQFGAMGQDLSQPMCEAAALVADYLTELWTSPCHDLWEEFGERVHTYTLAAIYAGLRSAAHILNRPAYVETAELIRAFILKRCTLPGRGFIKSVGVDLVDGSLAGLGVPYQVVALDDPLMTATVRRIEADLYVPGRGVHRYRGDSYYGGGAWLLLAAWLGWYYVAIGNREKAKTISDDLEKLATVEGDLPEQVVPPMLTKQSDYLFWVNLRGPIATPLLWSHAMYLILAAQNMHIG